MTLFKQISIIMSIFLLIIIASVMTLDFRSTTKYAQEELYSNAQNTTASLSLSLASAKGDIPTMSTMINAVFDSGYYKEIILRNTQGNEIYSRQKDSHNAEVPLWFSDLYQLNIQSASAHVSSGWRPIGILEVTVLQESAYSKLYKNFSELIETFIIISIVTFLLLFLLLRLLLHSLIQVKKQAEAVGNNDFIINDTIPYITEFKEVTLAMNKMVTKVKHIFEQEAEAVRNYHKMLYTDPISGFGNRKYFELKLKSLLHAEDVSSHGVLLSLYLEGMQKANTEFGHEKVNTLIRSFCDLITKSVSTQEHTIKGRVEGTMFTIIFPTLYINDIKSIADILIKEAIKELHNNELISQDYSVKLSAIEYLASDSVSDLMKKLEQSICVTEPNSIYISPSDPVDINKDIQKRGKLLHKTLESGSISLALQPVYDKEMQIFHYETYVRLIDEKGEIIPAATFMPLVHQMSLDTQLDRQVITHALKYAQQNQQKLALNISLPFIKDTPNIQWLKKLILNCSQPLSFELSNHDLLTCIDTAISFSKSIQHSGHIFGIDRFTAEGSDLNYLQAIKPSYIKIDSHYLHDMICDETGIQNNALKIIIQSLDIKIIATSIEDESTKDTLTKAGIKYFQGSLLSKPQIP